MSGAGSKDPAPAADYEIHFSAIRARRGLKPYAVMQVVDEGFSRGISQHETREEAEAAIAALQAPDTTGAA